MRAAKSWDKPRKVAARIEATTQGLDIRYVVTSLPGKAQYLYETVYCERGQAEHLIKLAVGLRPHLLPQPGCQSASPGAAPPPPIG